MHIFSKQIFDFVYFFTCYISHQNNSKNYNFKTNQSHIFYMLKRTSSYSVMPVHLSFVNIFTVLCILYNLFYLKNQHSLQYFLHFLGFFQLMKLLLPSFPNYFSKKGEIFFLFLHIFCEYFFIFFSYFFIFFHIFYYFPYLKFPFPIGAIPETIKQKPQQPGNITKTKTTKSLKALVTPSSRANIVAQKNLKKHF